MINLDRELDDNELVVKIVETNDVELFGLLYDRHAPKVYNRCLSILRNKVEAQDMTHDIFVLIFIKLRSFNGKSKFTTWLYSITYNYCINYIQRDKEKTNKKVDLDNHMPAAEKTISDEEIYQLRIDKLLKAMELIHVNDKILLIMKYKDNFTLKEIMEIMEIGESAVKMRLKRAKNKLVEIYNHID